MCGILYVYPLERFKMEFYFNRRGIITFTLPQQSTERPEFVE